MHKHLKWARMLGYDNEQELLAGILHTQSAENLVRWVIVALLVIICLLLAIDTAHAQTPPDITKRPSVSFRAGGISSDTKSIQTLSSAGNRCFNIEEMELDEDDAVRLVPEIQWWPTGELYIFAQAWSNNDCTGEMSEISLNKVVVLFHQILVPKADPSCYDVMERNSTPVEAGKPSLLMSDAELLLLGITPP